MHNWALDSIGLSKQHAYAAHVLMRRPSMTACIEQHRQTVEVVCFLHATLMELTDIALLQASRRSQELFRHVAQRAYESRARSNGATLQQAVRARAVLRDETKSWRERVLESRHSCKHGWNSATAGNRLATAFVAPGATAGGVLQPKGHWMIICAGQTRLGAGNICLTGGERRSR
ncbi:hypothetical protein QTH97_34265 [Variovorax sp. J22R24]|uniref:hypothetical protein n=1 Tax=Variovorax gracilis TaxID=3053502 RepID=UPI0025787BC7|nr:hypothetical protein [Variovorax sp. J22R24]MDM0110015.1 hypothetical protein [Variovorax sp. J22R24]